MRAVLHLGILALALSAVTTADAQGRRRSPAARQTTVVIDTGRVPTPRHGWRRARPHRSHRAAHADLQRQRRDHEEIVRISHRWRQVCYLHNSDARRHLKRRANMWIDREIAEAERRPDGGRYAVQLSALQRELNTRHRRRGFGYGHRAGLERKTRVLDELVALSALELRRAEARVRWHPRPAYTLR